MSDDGGPILVVDDDPHLRAAIARILQHEGHSVITAADGPTAVRLVKEREPGLLVLDFMMPGMNGAMVLDALRAELPDRMPPALLLTGAGHALERAERMGAVEGLEKPFNVPELLAAVARHRRVVENERS